MSYKLDEFQQQKVVQVMKEFGQLREMFCNVSLLIDEQNYNAIRDKFQQALRDICQDDDHGDKIYYSTLAMLAMRDRNKQKQNEQ